MNVLKRIHAVAYKMAVRYKTTIVRLIDRYDWLNVFVSMYILYVLPNNFKLQVAVTAIIACVALLRQKNFLTTIFTLFIMTSLFPQSGKFYLVQTIELGKILVEPYYSIGVQNGFGLTLSDIFAFTLILYGIKILIEFFSQQMHRKELQRIKNNPLTHITLIGWIVYLSFSLGSSLQRSYHPLLSVVWLTQYTEYLICFFCALYMIERNPSEWKRNVYNIIFALIIFQTFVGIIQILQGFLHITHNDVLSQVMYLPEEHSLFTRPNGTFSYSNQFGLFMVLFTMLLLSMGKQTQQITTRIAIACAITGVLFSQSRTIWIILFIFGCILFIKNPRPFFHFRLPHISFRMIIFSLLVFIPASFLFVSRISRTQYTFDQGSASIRTQMLEEGLYVLRQLPFTGFGVGTNVSTLYRYFPNGYVTLFPFDIHVAYLQMALESGVVATAFFFLPMVILLRATAVQIFVHKKNTAKTALLGFFVCVGIFIYYMLQPYEGKLEFPLFGLLIAHFSKWQYE